MKSWRIETTLGLLTLVVLVVMLWRQEQLLTTLQRGQAGAVAPQQQGGLQPAQQAPKPIPALSTVAFDFSIAGSPSRGNGSASVVLLEFSDFQCPFCGRYVRDTYPKIAADYIDSGKLRYVFRQFPLESIHPNALNSAIAGTCAANQGKFWEMHDRLFANQTNLELPALLTYGMGLGLNESKFSTCVNGRETAGMVQADRADAVRGGLTGTPGFFIGKVGPDGQFHAVRRISGAQPYSVFQSAIDDVLAGK